MLVNDRTARAIVVADECSIDTRERLVKALMHFRDRLQLYLYRQQRSTCECAPSPELIVPKLTPVELRGGLNIKLKGRLRERLRAYAQLCESGSRYLSYDSEIAQAGSMSPSWARLTHIIELD